MLVARFSAHIQQDIKRNWSSWNFGACGFEGTREMLDEYIASATDCSPAEVSGFEIFPENAKSFKFGELYENYYVVIDTRGDGISTHVLDSENVEDAIAEVKGNCMFDGTGDGDFVDCTDAIVVYSEKQEGSWGLHILEIED